MAKIIFKSKRPELSITEVLDQYECTVDDLFHAAAIGELTIYALAHDCLGGYICDVDKSIDATLSLNIYTGQEPPTPLIEDTPDPFSFAEETNEEHEKPIPDKLTIGNRTIYRKSGAYRQLYEPFWLGLQPITPETFLSFRVGTDSVKIELNISKNFDLSGSAVERFYRSDFQLQDALKDGKLFVMKADLQKLVFNALLDPEDVKPDGAVSRKTLLKLVLGMAMNRYNYDPDKTRTDVPKTIEIGVNTLGIDLTDDTIRKALNEAVATIPRKLHKT